MSGVTGKQNISLSSGNLSIGSLSLSDSREVDSLRGELESSQGGDSNSLPQKALDISEKINALNVSSALQIIESAATEILSLRTQQLAVAETAESDSTNGERAAELQAENDRLQTRIDSIVSGTTFNGNSLLQGSKAFTVRFSQQDINHAINTGDPSAFVANLSVSLSSTDSATTAVSVIEDAIEAGNSFAAGIGSAADKAAALVRRSFEPAIESQFQRESQRLEVAEAEQLASEVAQEISSLASGDPKVDETLSLLDATSQRLTQSRVSELTRED